MRIEQGQIIVVAARSRIRRIPAAILALRAVSDFDMHEQMAAFVAEDPAAAREAQLEKRALAFVNWAIRSDLVELVSPMAAVWDLHAIGQLVGEPPRGGEGADPG